MVAEPAASPLAASPLAAGPPPEAEENARESREFSSAHRPRVYVAEALFPGKTVTLGAQATHHLGRVLRARRGQKLTLFNGRDGEWHADITDVGKKAFSCAVTTCFRPQVSQGSGVSLLFSPLKAWSALCQLLRTATELNVDSLTPVLTAYTQTRVVREEKYRAVLQGACEQSGRLTVPRLGELCSFETPLQRVPAPLVVAVESGTLSEGLHALKQAPATLWIGPEGGFAPAEMARFADERPDLIRLGLGPTLLRAETAVCAGLAMVLMQRGQTRARPFS